MDIREIMMLAAVFVLGLIIGRMTAGKGERYVGQAPGQGSISVTPIRLPGIDPKAEEEIFSLLRAGKKIEAIKLYREVYGVDLKGAKDAIEAQEKR